MSPALMERYLSAAKVVSRSAVGTPPPAPGTAIYRVPPETQQHDRIEQLPYGTRGGTLVRHLFPLDGEYDIRVDMSSDRGRSEPQTVDVTIDGSRVALVMASSGEDPEVRVPVRGGPHDVGVAFLRMPPDLVEHGSRTFSESGCAIRNRRRPYRPDAGDYDRHHCGSLQSGRPRRHAESPAYSCASRECERNHFWVL